MAVKRVLIISLFPVVACAVDFSNEVKPILLEHCIDCHNGEKRKGGLVLTSYEWATTPSDSGEVVIKPAGDSPLMHRVRSEDDDRMPPKGPRLSDRELVVLDAWVKAGAPWTENLEEESPHWAYLKPERPVVPKNQHAVDFFVRKKLKTKGMSPAPRADKARLIRRLHLDLIGLPPPLETVRAFEAGKVSYEQVVDELLASPRYGEHWARQWLDLARYADSNGFQADQIRESWAFRDWVINALNADMPFDQFSIEQLAGDMLPDATIDQKIATGFHRTVTCNVEAGVHPEANRHDQVFDRVNTTGLVWLGTSLECAQCHNHKYDPFSQKEYYELFAFFNNTPLEVDNGGKGVSFDFTGPFMDLPQSPEQVKKKEALQARLNALNAEMKTARADAKKSQRRWESAVLAEVNNRKPYRVLKPQSIETTGSEAFEHQADGSFLARGTVPSTVIYTVKAKSPGGMLTALRLDAMTDPSLPGNGPGRGDPKKNNFILSEIEIYASSEEEERGERINIIDVRADFSQKGWDVVKSINGNRKDGWAIAPEFSKPHWATFIFEQPIPREKPFLTVVLDQNYGRGRVLGRVKLSVTEGNPDAEMLPEEVMKALVKGEKRSTKEQKTIDTYYSSKNPDLLAAERVRKKVIREFEQIKPPRTLVMEEMSTPRETHMLIRGDYLNKGMKVSHATPRILHAWDETLPKTRWGFAQWLMSPENPLTARVTVNRWWGNLFGIGLVRTEEDFGTMSEPPTHPALLDWLATEFVASGWSMKHMLKVMVMSETYRQDARSSVAQLEADPENRLLGRGPRHRMTAEMIRDNALAISGLLSETMHGPPVYPPQPSGIWRQVGRNEPKYTIAVNENRFRRGIYVIWRRAAPYPSFVNFDGTDRSACAPKRSRTNTPLQALTLLNDEAYVEISLGFAQRILREGGKDKIEFAFRSCLSRAPKLEERREIALYLDEERQRYAADVAAAKSITGGSPISSPELDPVELAAWQSVSSVLLNLSETITK